MSAGHLSLCWQRGRRRGVRTGLNIAISSGSGGWVSSTTDDDVVATVGPATSRLPAPFLPPAAAAAAAAAVPGDLRTCSPRTLAVRAVRPSCREMRTCSVCTWRRGRQGGGEDEASVTARCRNAVAVVVAIQGRGGTQVSDRVCKEQWCVPASPSPLGRPRTAAYMGERERERERETWERGEVTRRDK